MAKFVRRLAPSLLLLGGVAVAAPGEEAVASLPGYGRPPAPQWSGFLNASAVEPGTMLHYWYSQAESADHATLPVVLWLNGGPGSTSILGFLQEHGPLLINATGGLMHNPYAWTKQANVMIIESPAGVGYSYCQAMLQGGSCINTDKSTAAANRAALQDFFKNKFPELQSNEFYITGESYAGVYVPTLAAEILENAKEINLKGVGVGDPCTDNAAQSDSMDMMWYAHKNGFLLDADFDLLWKTCKRRHPSILAAGEWHRTEGRTVAATSPLKAEPQDARCKAATRRFLAATSRGFSQEWPKAWINDLSLFGPAAVTAYTAEGSLNYMTAAYMKRDDVRKALHVEASPTKTTWPGPAEGWSYTSDYAACNAAAKPGAPSMIDFYRTIAPKLKRTVVFNGDTDPCVSYEGTRIAIEQVGYEQLPGRQYRPWFFKHGAAAASFLKEKPLLFGPDLSLADAGYQFGGHVVDYEHNLSFVTIHGSGHMVPQFRPQAAEQLLRKLLSGEAFAPPLPTDKELETLSDDDFDKTLDSWTDLARGGQADKAQAEQILV
mmetsp:Transcript_60748/g.109458  ORF Transcript_60748/g.109458 Transcript_60748/m.109458 type:complete len:549 (-) Transcript_60748:22-1668(-)